MFSLKQATLLALVGTAFAAPLAHRAPDNDIDIDWQQRTGRMSTNAFYEEGKTLIPVNADALPAGSEIIGYTTITIYPGSEPTASATYSAPETIVTVTQGSYTAPAAAASSPAASSGTSTGGSQSGGVDDYMAVVSKWRAAGGLKPITQSSKLEANALKTVTDGNGVMKHELNPGTMGQVLAPGNAGDFEHVYVGGWLCEIPTLPGLDGICSTQSQGWSYDGQTGHAEILTNPQYTSIGCALYAGIWGCDFGY